MDTNKLPWFLETKDPASIYTSGKAVVLDFETDSHEYGSALHDPNDLVLSCWQVIDVSTRRVIKKRHIEGGIYEQQELLDDIASVDFLIAQNAKFELQWLRRCGAELRDILVYDTLLAAWVIDGNKLKPRSLGALCNRYGIKGKVDVVASLIKFGVPVRSIHSGWLLEYCHQDVEATKEVFFAQWDELSNRELWHLVFVRNLTCSVLADIEFEGMTLDAVKVKEEYIRVSQLKETVGAELATLTGGINLGSPKQLTTYLYDTLGFTEAKDHRGEPVRTGKGERSAAATTLSQLKPSTEEQSRFLKIYKDYNKADSLLSKNLEYFKLTCEQKGGVFFGELKQNVVQTHRLASSGIPILFEGLKKTKRVQLQNIPREYKELFWSGDEEWELFEADSSQVEFRVAVDMAEDEVGTYEVVTGVDIHSFTAEELTKAGEPTTRQEAKAKTFRPLTIAA